MGRNSKRLSVQSGLAAALLAGSISALAAPACATEYNQINLVTDNQAFLQSQGYAPAATVDTSLVNPWGISHTATSPFWVSDNGTGLSPVYNASGGKLLTETISPPPLAPIGTISTPTGQVATSSFTFNSLSSSFIFATEDGTIAARLGNSATATVVVDNSIYSLNNPNAGAVYKGLATATVGGVNFLYAANFNSGKIDVFSSTFAPVNTSAFVDPNIPVGYAPFNVQVLNGSLYVTYALQDAAKHDDVAGAGNGFVDEYKLSDGSLTNRVVSQGLLNSPWGLDIAPAGFGQYANDLLVGNFGDGTINAYNPNGTNAYIGTLEDDLGNPIAIEGLWGLINGTGGANGGGVNNVYFAAGIGDEGHGLFGALSPLPEPASLALLGAGLVGMAGMRTARRRRRVAA